MTLISLKRKMLNEFPDVFLDLYLSSRILIIGTIYVDDEVRGLGIGTHAMESILAHAALNNWMVVLTPSVQFGSDYHRLVSFYEGFGFDWEYGNEEMVLDFRNNNNERGLHAEFSN